MTMLFKIRVVTHFRKLFIGTICLSLFLIGSTANAQVTINTQAANISLSSSPQVVAQALGLLFASQHVRILGYGKRPVFVPPDDQEFVAFAERLKKFPSTDARIAVLESTDADRLGVKPVEVVSTEAIKTESSANVIKVRIIQLGADETTAFVPIRCLCSTKNKFSFFRSVCDAFRLRPLYPSYSYDRPIQISYRDNDSYRVAYLSRAEFKKAVGTLSSEDIEKVYPDTQPVTLTLLGLVALIVATTGSLLYGKFHSKQNPKSS